MAPLSPLTQIPEYTSLLAQCFSPDGQYLAVGNQSGQVAIYHLERVLQRSRQSALVREEAVRSEDTVDKLASANLLEPLHFLTFPVGPGRKAVLAMISNQRQLVIGIAGEISGWSWSNIYKKSPKASWSLTLPPQPGTAMDTDVNYLALNQSPSTAGHLIVAGGDNQVHVFDLETRFPVQIMEGHQSYIHSVSHDPQSDLIASGSEDGTVRLWDVRRRNPNTTTLVPQDNATLARPALGKWIGAVSLHADWLACGGGPRASVWHLRTMSPNEALPPDEAGVHEIRIHGDRVLIGGQKNILYQANLSGQVQSEVPVSSSCIYSIVCQDEPIKILACSGSSSKIDICAANFSYKDQTISFPM